MYIMRWLLLAIAVAGVFSVAAYNRKEAVRRQVSVMTKEIEKLKVQNAQLKNDFYAALDTRTLVSVADRLGYVRDNTPAHLTFRSDGSAVQDGPAVSFRNRAY